MSKETRNADIAIRPSRPADWATLRELYTAAFPDEDLVPLARDLLEAGSGVQSLIAIRDEALAGHIALTTCRVSGRPEDVGLLGPLAVRPDTQRRGIGGALVRAGLETMKRDGAVRVQVLGDPAYYGRFGFKTDSDVEPPYELPRDWLTAWQSICLVNASKRLNGKLSVPDPWRNPALWLP